MLENSQSQYQSSWFTRFLKTYNQNILKVLRLSRKMMVLADEGDVNRQDKSCGVLYGSLRDTAYKLRRLAEKEIEIHKETGLWESENGSLESY